MSGLARESAGHGNITVRGRARSYHTLVPARPGQDSFEMRVNRDIDLSRFAIAADGSHAFEQTTLAMPYGPGASMVNQALPFTHK
jgi:hypothetical protein